MRLKSFVFIIGIILIRLGINGLLFYSHPGLDSSWWQALFLAIQKGEVFGRDFVFNYGPLGYLNLKTIGPNVSKWFILAIEIFTLFHYVSFWKALCEKFPKHGWYLTGLMLFLLYPFGSLGDFSFTYLFFVCFWLFQSFQKKSITPLIIAGISVILIFFVKLNLNLVAYILYIVTIVWGVLIKRINSLNAFWAILFVTFGIFATAKILHVDLTGYIKVTIWLIDSYPDAMSAFLYTKNELLYLATIEIFIGLSMLCFTWKNISFDPMSLYFVFIVILLFFLSHKQAHTAISPPNEYGFFNFIPWLLMLLWLVLPLKTTFPGFSWAFKIFILLYIIGLQTFWFFEAKKEFIPYVKQFTKFKIEPIKHIKAFKSYDYNHHFIQNEKPLQNEIIQKIGSSSVDIFQTEVDYIFFNRLNYVHRPVIQSYQACNEDLMNLNAKKFNSTSAPEFVLYRSSNFRQQNPMWVETPSSIALLERYKVDGQYSDSGDTLLLLKKQAVSKKVGVKYYNFGSPRLNQEFPIPKTDSLLIGQFNFEYSFIGKLSKLFFQPPYLFARVRYENGLQEDFRVVSKILEAGIIINRKITTQLELKHFFENAGAKNPRILSVYFYSPFPSGFKN